MKCSPRQCNGFAMLEVLLCLTALSIAVSVCLKWCIFRNHQRSILHQKQRLMPCVSEFSFWLREQPRVRSCVGTWYAVRNASKSEMFDFIRKPSDRHEFKITVENSAWETEKTSNFCITPQGMTEENVAEPLPPKPEFLIVRFYAYEKKHVLHTCFVPVTAEKFKKEELMTAPVERFMLMPKAEKTSKNRDK